MNILKYAPLAFLIHSISCSHAVQSVEDVSTVTALYAYGKNISGAPVFYGDGLAYIGSEVPSWLKVAANVTFTSGTNASVPWTVSSNSTTFPTSTPTLYLIPTAGSFSQVGFLSSNDTAPAGATTTGFIFFGTSVAFQKNDSDIQLQFWAQSTNTTGVWRLLWNSDGTALEASVPVTLKKTPPTLSG